jgi:hypothetical protein
MKKISTLLFAFTFTIIAFAQLPQKMSYQAVIRNSSDQLITSHSVGMRISILLGSTSGTAVYVETQSPTTNANGLVSIEIGGGTIVTGTFVSIDWSAGTYFIKTETDPTGGTSYSITGTSQLLSVPYALYAKTVASYPETDPVFSAWNKSTGISINASQVSDFQTSVTNNAAVLANTAKETNATHTGDVTGSGVLTLATVNSNVGTFNNITINAKGLATAGSNVSYLTSETDPTVKAITGIVKSDGTTISAATAGTDYLTPTGSAALLTGFPTLNQNTTGSAASFTGSLTGDVTGTQGATVVTNAAVIGKVLTGYVSGAGTVATTDNILQAIQKLNGNNPMHYIGESYGGGIVFYVYDNGRHGLIAATVNQSTGIQWYNGTYRYTGTTGDGLGAGAMNTAMIVATQISDNQAGNFAAKVCADYSVTVGGVNYGDWYLPSKYELNILYLQQSVVGGFVFGSNYLSSTEYDSNTVWVQSFYNGGQEYTNKSFTNVMRAIRGF